MRNTQIIKYHVETASESINWHNHFEMLFGITTKDRQFYIYDPAILPLLLINKLKIYNEK